ncbi:MAG: hypothetical protein ACRDKI_12745 [Solirubrobacterales bacterium]
MEYPKSRFIARWGAVFLIAGLFLPWYKFDLGQLGEAFGAAAGGSLKISGIPTSQTFSAWDSARTVFVILFLFGSIALAQIPFATPGIVGRIFMFAGFGCMVLLGYKIVHPPLDFLELLKMKLKPQIGIFLTTFGAAIISYAGWEQVKRDLAAPSRTDAFNSATGSDWHTSVATNSANAGYAQPQTVGQAQAAMQAQQAAMGAQAAAPQAVPQPPQAASPSIVPPDPFAPPPPPAG